MCTPPSQKLKNNFTPRKSSPNNDSFNRLFGSPEMTPPRRASLTKHGKSVNVNEISFKLMLYGFYVHLDITKRNPVTGNGVDSWDCRPASRNSPRVHTGKHYIEMHLLQKISITKSVKRSTSV